MRIEGAIRYRGEALVLRELAMVDCRILLVLRRLPSERQRERWREREREGERERKSVRVCV